MSDHPAYAALDAARAELRQLESMDKRRTEVRAAIDAARRRFYAAQAMVDGLEEEWE